MAAPLKPYDDFAKATLERNAAVTSIAATRFKWERMLRELAEVTSDGVWLTSVKGTLAPTTTIDGGSGDGATSRLRGLLTVPALELVGCAVTEQKLPAYMDRLQAMSGVSERVPRFEVVAYFEPGAAAAALTPAVGVNPSPADAVKDPGAKATATTPAPAPPPAAAPGNQTAATAAGAKP